jgi:hypothetical protein
MMHDDKESAYADEVRRAKHQRLARGEFSTEHPQIPVAGMEKQQQACKLLDAAVQDNRRLWRERYDEFQQDPVTREAFIDTSDWIGTVRGSLRNFCVGACLPQDLQSLPIDQVLEANELEWQKGMVDPKYWRRLRRVFFAKDGVLTSMDMARLGVAFLAESNLIGFTNIPVETPSDATVSADPVAAAYAIVNASKKSSAAREWSKRIRAHLDVATEDALRSNPKFAVFIAAVKAFLDHQPK